MNPKKPKSPQQEQFAKKFKQAKAIENQLETPAAELLQQWKSNNPDLAKDYTPRISIVCRPKGQAGASKIIPMLGERIFYRSNEGKSRAEITAQVQKELPELKVHAALWNRPLQGWEKKSIAMNSPFSITKCKTLSDIYRRQQMELATKAAIREYKPKISINKETLTIGQEVYPIQQRRHGKNSSKSIRVKVRGKDQWIRVDALVCLLQSGI